MDTTDPDIRFDQAGVCSHCHRYERNIRDYVLGGEAGHRRLEALASEIRRAGAGKKYDCLIGVSGGVDSSFVALRTHQLGLRPLAVHLDNGWDSELAVKNIELTLGHFGIDLHTHVLDWEEFRDLQVAFLRASTPDSEIPTDHAIFSLMYWTAEKFDIRYILSGVNRRTESHLPKAWSQGHMDWGYIRSVHRKFGTRRLRNYPHMNLWAVQRLPKRREMINLLDFGDYVKRDAIGLLERDVGWRNYAGKHYESIYTRFYQGVLLPTKFGFDKRKVHFSSLICAGEMLRELALSELEKPPYPLALQNEDHAYVVKKLELTESEFGAIMGLPAKSYWDYPSYGKLFMSSAFLKARSVYRAVRGIRTPPRARTTSGGEVSK